MMQLSPFGTIPLVEFTRASTINMTIIMEALNKARELGYVFAHIGEGWNAVKFPKSADELVDDEWKKFPISAIELLPLKTRKGRHKHVRAIHALIAVAL